MSDHDEIAADIRAALDETAGAALQTIEVDPEGEEPVELPEEPEKSGIQRERDASGKFVAKSEEVEQDTTEQPVEAEPSQEVIRPPASWSALAKSKFATLDPDIQKEVLKREQDVVLGFQDRAEQLKRYEPLDQVLAPHRQKWTMAGVDEATAVKQLLAASDWLERDPAGAINYLARQYGAQIPAQPMQGQAFAPQPQAVSHPENTALLQRIAQLEESIQQAQTAPIQGQVESFFADPKNLYAENVRSDMAVLLKEGRAKDLPEAYEMACWMRPDIRPLLQTPQVKPVVDQARVDRAKAAGASVTGSPSAAPIAAKSDGSIDNDIRAAYAELTARA